MKVHFDEQADEILRVKDRVPVASLKQIQFGVA